MNVRSKKKVLWVKAERRARRSSALDVLEIGAENDDDVVVVEDDLEDGIEQSENEDDDFVDDCGGY